MLINCQTWTTYTQTQILLKASLSCTSLKQWSRWSPKDGVQQWDTVQNPQSCAWLVVRQNQFRTKKKHIKYVDTENQLAIRTRTLTRWTQSSVRRETNVAVFRHESNDRANWRFCGIERRRVCCQWKAKGQCSRGDKSSFGHDSDERAKSKPKPLHPLEPPAQRGRSASGRGILRGRSPSGKSNRQPCNDFFWKVCALNFLVTIGILPNVTLISQNRVVNSAIGARFRTERLRNNQKKPNKGGDKM